MPKKLTMNDLRKEELSRLKKELGLSKNDVLTADDVVKGAKSKSKYPNLHSGFEWDNDSASHKYRLWQARELLVSVIVLTPNNKPLQAFVSLLSDRQKPGGGYRETLFVMSDKDLRRELLEQAWVEFETWRRRYEYLKELAPVFDAANKSEKQKPKLKLRRKKASRKTRQTASA